MKKCILVIALVISLFTLSGCQKAVEATPALTASDYVDLFVSAGLPIDNIIVFTEETDPNNLLGRPNQYASKVNFADTRVDQYDESNPVGGTVEVFANKTDMQTRKTYIETIYASSDLFGGEYFYVSSDELALVRISFDLTPVQAEEYNAVINPD